MEGIGTLRGLLAVQFSFIVTFPAACGCGFCFFRRTVAVATGPQRRIVAFRVMVAGETVYPISALGRVSLMGEKDLAGRDLEHDSNRLLRRFGGKGGITEDPYDQKDNAYPVCQVQFFFCRHRGRILSRVVSNKEHEKSKGLWLTHKIIHFKYEVISKVLNFRENILNISEKR